MGRVWSGWSETAFIRVSMSRVTEVEVGAGTDVVDVHGVGGADGQGVDASMGREVEVVPEGVRGRGLLNLL